MAVGLNLLTSNSGAGVYGIWTNRAADEINLVYNQTTFVMTNDIEIVMYSLGASFPGKSTLYVDMDST